MNTAEFILIARDMQARWYQFPIPASALDAYVTDLQDLAANDVRVAVDALAADGRERPPTSGQIRRRVAEMQLDAPSWDQVRTALVRWRRGSDRRSAQLQAWACPQNVCDGRSFVFNDKTGRDVDCVCRPQRLALRTGHDELPALAVEFIRDLHVASEELGAFLDEGSTTAEAQVRGRWGEFVARAIESRILAGLPTSADLPRLESARAEEAERSGVPRRLNAMAAIAVLERGDG